MSELRLDGPCRTELPSDEAKAVAPRLRIFPQAKADQLTISTPFRERAKLVGGVRAPLPGALQAIPGSVVIAGAVLISATTASTARRG
jgi:hypothetical protein